jgi:hypothetical protein
MEGSFIEPWINRRSALDGSDVSAHDLGEELTYLLSSACTPDDFWLSFVRIVSSHIGDVPVVDV